MCFVPLGNLSSSDLINAIRPKSVVGSFAQALTYSATQRYEKKEEEETLEKHTLVICRKRGKERKNGNRRKRERKKERKKEGKGNKNHGSIFVVSIFLFHQRTNEEEEENDDAICIEISFYDFT